MIHKTLTIVNKLGLHARASAKLINLAGKFSSNIQLQKDETAVNAKSIMGVMMLAASCGTDIDIIIDGDDEIEAMAAIEELIANKFNEE